MLDETRGQDSRLLFPDFSLVTQLRDRSCSLLHMEGKAAANKGLSQICLHKDDAKISRPKNLGETKEEALDNTSLGDYQRRPSLGQT